MSGAVNVDPPHGWWRFIAEAPAPGSTGALGGDPGPALYQVVTLEDPLLLYPSVASIW